MLKVSFQIKLFLAALSTALLALIMAGGLFALTMQRQTNARVEETLTTGARIAAELVARAPQLSQSTTDVREFDAEADRIGALMNARVTLIAPNGVVLGDSAEPLEVVATMENHSTRPEVVDARVAGLGMARRASATTSQDLLYAAIAVQHPRIGYVRVALPLTNVREQLVGIVTATIAGLGLALLGGAVTAGVLAGRIGQRVRAIAWIAERYRQGDLTPPRLDYGDDELGMVARALDDSVHELGNRIQDLERDRGRMAAILAGMIEGVIVVDQAGRLQLVNLAAQDMLKMPETPIGRHYVESIGQPAIADLVTAALFGTTAESREFSSPRDASRTVIARAAPVAAGSAHGVVLVLHDVTELKRVDKVRRDFVANVSHELRTPLTAIRGYVEALSEGDTTADENQRFLDIIARHAKRMERLVQDLLRLARLEAGQEILELTSCDLKALIQSVAADVDPAFESKDQQFTLSVAADASRVSADPVKLHDVMRNLLANASAYSPEGSTINVVTRRAADRVAIDVIDQGPGIPEADRTRVFERFYRVDKSRARDPGGTGLGLSIVKHLTELHGGRVSVTNRPEGGACFTVELKAGR